MNKKIIVLICFIVVSTLGFSFVKEPNVAGSFYPADSSKLIETINGFMNNVSSNVSGDVKVDKPWAIIVPHAAYKYSGQTAAHAYKLIEGDKRTAVILAPSHYYSFTRSSIYRAGAFKTPLGEMAIDEGLAESIFNSSEKVVQYAPVFEKEHSLEVQLPFLQVITGNRKIVPIIIGDSSGEETRQALRDVLFPLVQKNKILVVVSTDLAHYKSEDANNKLDRNTIALIEKNDLQGLINAVNKNKSELCGLPAVATLMLIAESVTSDIKILDHTNSGQITGKKKSVVGYLSAAYYKKKAVIQKEEKKEEKTEQ